MTGKVKRLAKTKLKPKRRSNSAAALNKLKSDIEHANQSIENEFASLRTAVDELRLNLENLQAQSEAKFNEMGQICAAAEEAAAGAENLAKTLWDRQVSSPSERTSGTQGSRLGKISDEGSRPVNSDSANNAGFPRRRNK